MTTTDTATIQVATVDFRRALKAVVPHAERNKTGDNAVEHRFRLCFAASEVYVMATNGQTLALAAVPIQEDNRAERFAADDGAFWVDLAPRAAALILQHFPLSTGSGESYDEMLELTATSGDLNVQDVGGLWAGEDTTFVQLAASDAYPDVLGLLAPALANRSSSPNSKPLVANGALLRLFNSASEAYEQPIELYPTGTDSSRGWVVQVGQYFVGTVESRHLDDDGMKRRDSAHRRWLERFPAKKLAAV